MQIDEFLIALGVKADTKKLQEFEQGLDGVSDAAKDTESSMLKAYDATDAFVSEVGTAMGIITFFTGVLGGALGVFHSTIMELDELIEEEKLLHKVTKDQIEQQQKYKESVETLGKRFQSLKVELAFGFLPTLQNMISGLDEFLKKNKDLIVNGITAFLNAISKVVQVGVNFVRFIDRVISGTVGWKNALLILGAALAWVKRAMILAFVTNPITWVIAAIGGLLLLIDDFMTYLDGGESLFGEYWGSMLGWINDNKDALLAMKDTFMAVMDFIAGVVALVVGIFTGNTSLMSVAWQGMVDSFIAAWNGFASFFEPAAQKYYSIVNNMVTKIKAVFFTLKDALIMPFRIAFEWITDKFSQLPSFISGIASRATFGLSDRVASAVSNIRNSSIVNNTNVNASVNVNSPNAVLAGTTAAANINALAKSNTGGVALA